MFQNQHLTTSEVISKQGKLLIVGDTVCSNPKEISMFTLKKNRKKTKPKSRDCVVFIFQQSVIVCEKMSNDQEFSLGQIDYWTSFSVSFITIN